MSVREIFPTITDSQYAELMKICNGNELQAIDAMAEGPEVLENIDKHLADEKSGRGAPLGGEQRPEQSEEQSAQEEQDHLIAQKLQKEMDQEAKDLAVSGLQGSVGCGRSQRMSGGSHIFFRSSWSRASIRGSVRYYRETVGFPTLRSSDELILILDSYSYSFQIVFYGDFFLSRVSVVE